MTVASQRPLGGSNALNHPAEGVRESPPQEKLFVATSARVRVAFFVVLPMLDASGRKERVVPISKERKDEIVARLVEIIQESDGFAIVQTQGMTVAQVQTLRNKLRNAGGRYVVSKNKLLGKALEQCGWVVPTELLKGPTGIAFGYRNFPGVARALLDYIKETNPEPEKLRAVGGVMAGKEVFKADGLEAVSNLPTLDELRAQLIGLVVAPSQGLVNVINAATASVVNVLQAYLDDRNKEDAA